MAHVKVSAGAAPARKNKANQSKTPPRPAAADRNDAAPVAQCAQYGNLLERMAPHPAQGEMANAHPKPAPAPRTSRPNRTGLPDRLKSGVEELSGYSLDNVRVHYYSPKPAQLQAHAYAQGTEIHVAPGQERHLAHEAWHVVQQKQGRVRPTLQAKGVAINDDAGLEHEADLMGAAALNRSGSSRAEPKAAAFALRHSTQLARFNVIQRVINHVAQPQANLCWAAVGWSLHQHLGGAAYANLNAFVTGQGNQAARTAFGGNTATDIDNIIGSGSTTNRLTASDNAGQYGRNGISQKLNAGHPIVANVNNNHYIILTAHSVAAGVYQLSYMDPAQAAITTQAATFAANSTTMVTGVGNHVFSVLYYTG